MPLRRFIGLGFLMSYAADYQLECCGFFLFSYER